jgi:hypothetical protein
LTSTLSTLSKRIGELARIRPLRWGAAAGLFAAFWWYAPPDNPTFRFCPFYLLTGRPCPFCGLTRAFCAIAKGHLDKAVHFHALSPLAFVLFFAMFWEWRWREQFFKWGIVAILIYGAWRAAFA